MIDAVRCRPKMAASDRDRAVVIGVKGATLGFNAIIETL